MSPAERSASIAICLPGIASRLNRAATSAMRPEPLVMTMKFTTSSMISVAYCRIARQVTVQVTTFARSRWCAIVGCTHQMSVDMPRRTGSARPQPRRGERQHIVLERSANPVTPRTTGRLEIRHLPVTDLSLSKIVQGQRAADPTASVVHHDVQEPSADRFRCLLAWTFPGDPSTSDALLLDMFSHGPSDSDRDW